MIYVGPAKSSDTDEESASRWWTACGWSYCPGNHCPSALLSSGHWLMILYGALPPLWSSTFLKAIWTDYSWCSGHSEAYVWYSVLALFALAFWTTSEICWEKAFKVRRKKNPTSWTIRYHLDVRNFQDIQLKYVLWCLPSRKMHRSCKGYMWSTKSTMPHCTHMKPIEQILKTYAMQILSMILLKCYCEEVWKSTKFQHICIEFLLAFDVRG